MALELSVLRRVVICHSPVGLWAYARFHAYLLHVENYLASGKCAWVTFLFASLCPHFLEPLVAHLGLACNFVRLLQPARRQRRRSAANR